MPFYCMDNCIESSGVDTNYINPDFFVLNFKLYVDNRHIELVGAHLYYK